MNKAKADQVVLQVTLYTCVQELLGSISGWVTDYPDRFFMVLLIPLRKIQG
jgi:hypothetical protein